MRGRDGKERERGDRSRAPSSVILAPGVGCRTRVAVAGKRGLGHTVRCTSYRERTAHTRTGRGEERGVDGGDKAEGGN